MFVVVLPGVPMKLSQPSFWLYTVYSVGPHAALSVIAWLAYRMGKLPVIGVAAGVTALVMLPTIVLWYFWATRDFGASNGLMEFGTPCMHWLFIAFVALALVASPGHGPAPSLGSGDFNSLPKWGHYHD